MCVIGVLAWRRSCKEPANRVSAILNWCRLFLLTFFAIHVGRMEAEWNLIGLLSPAVAVVGDIAYSLLLAYGIVAPLSTLWRWLTRPLERRAWRHYLARLDAGTPPGFVFSPVRRWLIARLGAARRWQHSRGSPTAALGWGLRIGLPLTAILIAITPLWGSAGSSTQS